MNQFVEYQDWPSKHKVMTALSIEKLVIKNDKFVRNIGIFVLVVGLISAPDAFFSSTVEINEAVAMFGLIFIGVLNIFYSKIIKWVNENSSWEERFNNTSSTKHKLIALTLMAIMYVFIFFMLLDIFGRWFE